VDAKDGRSVRKLLIHQSAESWPTLTLCSGSIPSRFRRQRERKENLEENLQATVDDLEQSYGNIQNEWRFHSRKKLQENMSCRIKVRSERILGNYSVNE
jgi:hypothetical protein